jgi:hypothetical protein
MRHLVHSQFADFGDCHFCRLTWGIIPIEGDTFEVVLWAMRFRVSFYMKKGKFTSVPDGYT